jgi:hypothetical protein
MIQDVGYNVCTSNGKVSSSGLLDARALGLMFLLEWRGIEFLKYVTSLEIILVGYTD